MTRESDVNGRDASEFGALRWAVSIFGGILLLVMTSFAFYEGRKTYWDAQVKEMCEKDGGVTVYERVKISKQDSRFLWEQGLPLPTENTRKDSPYFWERTETGIREANPKVVRAETLIKRRSDGKALGKSVRYWRSGGDFPTGFSEGTSFICPQHADLSKQVFLVDGGAK